jgi:uncharacterized protein
MTRACALCGKAAVREGNKFWPLCSERCSLVDLGKWLGEEYRVPGEPDPNLATQSPPTREDDES